MKSFSILLILNYEIWFSPIETLKKLSTHDVFLVPFIVASINFLNLFKDVQCVAYHDF
jgi:hypothetical protein